MPAVFDSFRFFSGPYHYMRSSRTDFVIAPGTPVGFEGTRSRDRTDFVVVAIRPGLDPARDRRRRDRLLPNRTTTTASHCQNSRYSSLSIPRILS
ncbi:hypothetical protein BZL30_2089 [Mycobacterium kansasii]|uniref:Uncharacterized protein n=1 Tax=Mycobacterium kansasii TaxID=1768 RepID=A0A1V3XJN1_MYCKA|nr:hypothetical protein BZL30_2089 [Mycobacterium kansasii]